MISIAGLNKADVLAALYNASKPQGIGFLSYDSTPMGRDEAESFLARTRYFDYLKGRVMKVELSDDNELDPRLYDRDNGQGAAERAIADLRETNDVNSRKAQWTHHDATLAQARATKSRLNDPDAEATVGPFKVLTMGLADVAEPLNQAIDKAIKDRR